MQKIQELNTQVDIKKQNECKEAIRIIDDISKKLAESPNLVRMREWVKQQSAK